MAVCPYLLGKWRGYDPDTKALFEVRGFRLIDHISACARMCRFLMRDTEFGRRLFYLMDLSARSGVTYEEFTNLALVATICHDLGKANSQFQEMLWQMERYYLQHGIKPPATAPRFRQAYRHEIVSLALLTQHPQIRDWLQKVCPRHSELVAFAAYGHHIKTHRQFPQGQHPNISGPVFLSQLTPDLSELTKQMGLEPFPICSDTKTSVDELFQGQMDLMTQFMDDESSLSAALKWMVIISDTLGSITPENEVRLGDFEEHLKAPLKHMTSTPESYDYRGRCIQPLRDGGAKTPHEFQEKLSELHEMLTVFVDASCGRGKTDGAYMWADPKLRLVLSTPTTGTATQLFVDHLNDESTNRHSRRKIDQALQNIQMASNGSDDTDDDASITAAEVMQNFEGFEKQITYSTSDQILGLLSFSRRSVLWLLYLVQAQVVFDEFHDYDPTMTSWFKTFLDWFPNLRVLMMSASVTPAKRAILRVRSGTVHVQDTGKDIPSEWPRYRIHLVSKKEALNKFQPGTLWVVNRISVAQELGWKFPQALVYHSHFRYQDRVDIHRRFISEYRKEMKTIRGIATQVAEMSLDISALLLICEVCPPMAIIQRLGRLMRYLKKGDPVGHAYFYMPDDGYPYHPKGKLDQFEVWKRWLKSLEGRDLSQKDLATALAQFNPAEKVDHTDFPVYETEHRPLRKEDGTSTLGILRSDLIAGNLLRAPLMEIQKVEIPVHLTPKEMAALTTMGAVCRHRYVLDYNYDPRLGLLKK